jgi:hypothetical protein
MLTLFAGYAGAALVHAVTGGGIAFTASAAGAAAFDQACASFADEAFVALDALARVDAQAVGTGLTARADYVVTGAHAFSSHAYLTGGAFHVHAG